MPTLPAPASRSLVLYHGTLKRNMVMFRQENDGRLFVSMDVTNPSELSDPGLLRCVHNTLKKNELKGTYHKDLTSFVTRELLVDLPQHDVATPTLGYFLGELYAAMGGTVTDVELTGIAEAMVLARVADERIHSVFYFEAATPKLRLLAAPIAAESLVLHNDLPVDEQADLLVFSAGGVSNHFSLFDFFYDPRVEKLTSPRLSAKLLELWTGAVVTLTATEIRKTGYHSSDVSLPNRGGVSPEEALKNLMNPPSAALQYRIGATASRTIFIEPLKNRQEVILQTTEAVRVGFSDDPAAIGGGFLFPAGGIMGFTVSTAVSIAIKAEAADASVLIIQLGV